MTKIGDLRPGDAFVRDVYTDELVVYFIIHVEPVVDEKVAYSALRIFKGTSRIFQYYGFVNCTPPFEEPKYWKL